MSNNREFVMLAQPWDVDKHNPAGWFVSTKLDGQRALWDGGVTRGMPKELVPWANLKRDRSAHISTGLWTRYGNVIHAPDWFIDKLPKDLILDGEVYLGRGRFQEMRSIVAKYDPGEEWREVKYKVFDLPTPHVAFQDGRINNPNFQKVINYDECRKLLNGTMNSTLNLFFKTVQMMQRYKGMENEVLSFHNQLQLPNDRREATDLVYQMYDDEVKLKGEGLMLRAPQSYWLPRRSNEMLKVKDFFDCEGTVIGYYCGETGKYQGMLGSVVVDWNGKNFALSGFNDSERYLPLKSADYARKNPGELLIGESEIFPRGSKIRFKYKELTDEGLPREARFFR